MVPYSQSKLDTGMSTDSQTDPQFLLAQSRSTIASFSGGCQSLERGLDASNIDESVTTAAAAPGSEMDHGNSIDTIVVADDSAATERVTVSFRALPSRISPLPAILTQAGDESGVVGPDVTKIESSSTLPSRAVSADQNSTLLRQSNRHARIMLVDDEPLNVMALRQHLMQAGYSEFKTTSNATEALTLVYRECPDVVLLNINMPQVSGLEILRVMGTDPVLQHIPVLVLNAGTEQGVRRKAVELGASDFLNIPIDPDELLPRIRNAIIIKQHFDMVSDETSRLDQQVERRTRQLEATRQQLILSLARAAEHRDNDTGNHVLRVGRYTAIIAEELGYPEKRLATLEQAAQLHDVGKIATPQEVLNCPRKLDDEEWLQMKEHVNSKKILIVRP